MSGRAGIDKVLSDDGPEPPARIEGEQLPLLGGHEAPSDAHAPAAQRPAAPAAAGGGGSGGGDGDGSGRGRPKGARNRRTDEMVRYLNTFGQGPLVGLAKVVNAIRFGPDGLPDFGELAQALGMKRKEAAQFWQACAVQLAPYMHQKLPTAIDVTGDSAGSLVVVNFGAGQDDAPSDLNELLGGHLGEIIDGEIVDGDSEENQ